MDSACWKTPLCKYLKQLGQPVAFDSTLWFLIDDTLFWKAAPIIIYTTGVIIGSNFLYQNKEINYRIFIKYGKNCIVWKLFQIKVTMNENKIQFFYIEFTGAWIEHHLYVSSSKISNMLSNTTGCPNAPKNCTRGLFNMLNPNLPTDLLSHYSSNRSSK